jgi:hypothetical protein
MKKFVPLIIGLTVVGIVIGAFCFFAAKNEEAANAKWFYTTSRASVDSQWRRLPSGSVCVRMESYETYEFELDFDACVTFAEKGFVERGEALPYETCRAFGEKSRAQLECILKAEVPLIAEYSREYQKQEEAWEKRREAMKKAHEAEEKAQEAKRKIADKAITPTILKSIAVLRPNSDTERRQAAIYVSCNYDDGTAGYRVSLGEYVKASQKGVRRVEERFIDGRQAICNQLQADEDEEWLDDDGGDGPGR